MKRSHFNYLLAILFVIPLALSACSSSSNHDVTASQYPYGADGITTVSADGESTYNQTFEYNSALQVIGQNIEYTSYDDSNGGDPVIDYRRVYNYTYDPSITVASSVPTNLTPVAQKSMQYGNFGAVLSDIYTRYELDDETGILGTSPSYQREYYYSYTDSGLLLERTYVETSDAVVTGSTDTYTYNSAEDITSYTHTSVDSEGTSSTAIATYDYDSYGNLISYIRTVDGDVEYEETYTHSYTDGLRMQTIVTTNGVESDEETYQIDFLYNSQEQLISKLTSTDNYNDDGVYDSFTTNIYTYDSAGRLLSDSEEQNYDSDDDDIINYLYRKNLVWEYNEQGLMTTSSRETLSYSDPTTPTLSSHHKYIYNYEYADNGNIAMNSYESLNDADLDGSSFEVTSGYSTEEYSYNDAGYLTAYTDEGTNYSDENVFTYTDGILTEMTSLTNESSRYNTLFTYDDSGQLVQIASEDIYEFSTDTGLYSFTYNDDQTVTMVFEEDETENMTMTVDFTSEGIPTGTADFVYNSVYIEYPNSPEVDEYYNDMIGQTDDNDKSYLMKLKVPKIFEFLYNGMAKG